MSRQKIIWMIVIVCIAFLAFAFSRAGINIFGITTFFYNTNTCGDAQMKLQDALQLASQGECAEKGKTFFWGASCNSYTGTWWLSYSPDEPSSCNPRCVVNTDTKKSEVNYMCTGGIRYNEN